MNNKKIYLCKNCGAEIVINKEKVLNKCPYCGGIIIVSSTKEERIDNYYLTPIYDEKTFCQNYSDILDERIESIEQKYFLFNLSNFKFDCNIIGQRKYEGEDGTSYIDFQSRGHCSAQKVLIPAFDHKHQYTLIGTDDFDLTNIMKLDNLENLRLEIENKCNTPFETRINKEAERIVNQNLKDNEIVDQINVSIYFEKTINIYIPCFDIKTKKNNYIVLPKDYQKQIKKNKSNKIVKTILIILMILFGLSFFTFDILAMLFFFIQLVIFGIVKAIIGKRKQNENVSYEINDISKKYYRD